jgi:antitoxin VapB
MYILRRVKTTRAKLFVNGGSQAVRLPRECRFADGEKEVLIRRVGKTVILEAVDEWPEDFLAGLGSLAQDIERPKSKPIAALRDPFA